MNAQLKAIKKLTTDLRNLPELVENANMYAIEDFLMFLDFEDVKNIQAMLTRISYVLTVKETRITINPDAYGDD